MLLLNETGVLVTEMFDITQDMKNRRRFSLKGRWLQSSPISLKEFQKWELKNTIENSVAMSICTIHPEKSFITTANWVTLKARLAYDCSAMQRSQKNVEKKWRLWAMQNANEHEKLTGCTWRHQWTTYHTIYHIFRGQAPATTVTIIWAQHNKRCLLQDKGKPDIKWS